jgi:lipid-A-disaccharide synthase
MLIAGDPSGDMLAAELVGALRERARADAGPSPEDAQPLRTELLPRFFGAGGPRLAAAGVELAFDLTRHSAIGLTRALRKVLVFSRHFRQLHALARERQPDVVIGVDYGGFNCRFGRAIKNYTRKHSGPFHNWKPKIVQYVSPQVWASRPGRAYQLASSHDLVLSIIPFEQDWYARRVPQLRVQYVGHPLLDRYRKPARTGAAAAVGTPPRVVLLPGSRTTELRHHLDVMTRALELMRARVPALRAKLVVPTAALAEQARRFPLPPGLEVQIGGLPAALMEADLAIAKTGTITMECAFFELPTVTLYRLSWIEHEIARRLVTVKWISMPNLLAGEEVFPEFVQRAATPENVSRAALEFLLNEQRRREVKARLARVIALLGPPGANARAAEAILDLLR